MVFAFKIVRLNASTVPISGLSAPSPDEGSESNLPKDDTYGWIDPAVLSQAIPCRRSTIPRSAS